MTGDDRRALVFEDVEYARISLGELMERLQTQTNGLTEQEARARLEAVDPNSLKTEGGVSALAILLGQFRDPL
ncbi:MAG: cation-transporting P-type ATPase [Firmicutes bacterium]|nr:cation-transporting P-type ATPase [Bacillota bacterium]